MALIVMALIVSGAEDDSEGREQTGGRRRRRGGMRRHDAMLFIAVCNFVWFVLLCVTSLVRFRAQKNPKTTSSSASSKAVHAGITVDSLVKLTTAKAFDRKTSVLQ